MSSATASTKNALGGGMIIALSTLLAKIIGAVYKIPLVSILGVDGIGMYQLIFPVYAAAIALSSGGVSVLISRRVAAGKALGDNSGGGIMGAAFAYTLLLSLIAAGVICGLATQIAILQGREAIKLCYYLIAPSILIVGMSSCIRGALLGVGRIKIAAGAQLIEQIVKLGAGLTLSFLLVKKSVVWGVAGAVIGVTASELAGLIFTAAFYVFSPALKATSCPLALRNAYMKEYAPIMLSGIILPISSLIDSLLIVRLLTRFGYGSATADYGIMTGIVNTVVNMPTVIAIALAAAIVPALSYSYAKKDACGIKDRSSSCIKTALMIGTPCFFGLFALAPQLLKALYPSLGADQLALATALMRISSINVILASCLQIYTAIMQSLDRAGFCLAAGAILSVGRIGLEIALAYALGIKGICLAWAVYNLAYVLILIYKHAYLLGRNIPLVKNVSKILLSGVIMYAPIWLIARYVSNVYLCIGIGVAAGIAIYAPIALAMGIMSKDELKALPLGSKIYAIARRLNRRIDGTT